jgi:hypothetical protein
VISIEPALDECCDDAQGLTPGCGLDGFEVQGVGHAPTYELVDLLADLRRQRLFEPPFFAASCAAASSSPKAKQLPANISFSCRAPRLVVLVDIREISG